MIITLALKIAVSYLYSNFVNSRIFICTGDENGTFVIDLNAFSPGSHSLLVEATSAEGEVDTADIIFFSVQDIFGMNSSSIYVTE